MNTENFTTPEIIEHGNEENKLSENNEFDFTEKIITENNLKISLFPSKRKKVRKINVVIEGGFNITNIQVIKDNCFKLLQYFDMLNITLKNITDIDLTGIQLLQVLNSSSEFMQKTISIESELSKDDKALIMSAGMMELVSKRK